MKPTDLDVLFWESARLPQALSQLAVAAGLTNASVELMPFADSDDGAWMEWAAKRLDCEAQPLDINLCELKNGLAAYPSLLRVSESKYLAILHANRRRLLILTPSLTRKRVALQNVLRAIREPLAATAADPVHGLLRDAGLRGRALTNSLTELLDKRATHTCWVFRRAPGGKMLPLLRELGVLRNGSALIASHVIQYLLLIASWALLGSYSFNGRADQVWLYTWALILFTLLPFQVLATWLQGLFSIGLGILLKRRLLCGALKLEPDEVRHAGIGTFLGQALEAEAIERLALTGAIPGLLASIEIVFAMVLLGKLALILAVFTALAVYAAVRFLKRYQGWTDARLNLTHDLVEAMVGHRTRLVQQSPGDWHELEDQGMSRYFLHSRALDRIGSILIGGIPRLWLVVAVATLAPAVVNRSASPEQTAVQLGGVLLAYMALRKWTSSFTGIAAAFVAWKRIAPLFRAATRTELSGELLLASSSCERLLEAERVTFRYRPNGPPAVRECSLTVTRGDRILLEGSSGGGKTTFASLLTGIRQPESGLLLAKGLDRHTLGSAGWRQAVAAAPQFHENHLLAETLAFNLLMGRGWPASEPELEEAECVCRELGLGSLIDSMPSGLMQMVGEGGWQLSHGEKSRVFVARALLQNADVIILDESFAALDPENAKIALEYTIQRAPALIVIAHP